MIWKSKVFADSSVMSVSVQNLARLSRLKGQNEGVE